MYPAPFCLEHLPNLGVVLGVLASWCFRFRRSAFASFDFDGLGCGVALPVADLAVGAAPAQEAAVGRGAAGEAGAPLVGFGVLVGEAGGGETGGCAVNAGV